MEMTTKRELPRGRAKTETTHSGDGGLSALEERALRMRYGLEVSDQLKLESKAPGRPDVMKKLLEIEHRAFEKSGRLAALRRAAGVEVAKPVAAKKDKIVGKLKAKAKTAAKPTAKAAVTAKASVKAKASPKKR